MVYNDYQICPDCGISYNVTYGHICIPYPPKEKKLKETIWDKILSKRQDKKNTQQNTEKE